MRTKDIDERGLGEIVQSADVPLTAKRVAQAALGSSGQKAIEALEKMLESLRQSGSVFIFPPEQKGWGIRFGSVPPIEWVQRRILDKVTDGGGKVTEKQVKEHLHKWELKLYDEAVSALIRNGKLHYLTVRNKYVVSSAPTSFDYLLGRQVTALKEILERINRRRRKALTLPELRSFLEGPFTPSPPAELTEEMIRAWYDEDVPLRGGVTSVPITWTWKHYVAWCKEHDFEADLSRFHAFFRNLFQEHRIELIPHSRTHEIPPGEVELALSNQSGEVLYYWRWR